MPVGNNMTHRLLLVDDDPDQLALLQALLPGYATDTTTSPNEAIEWVRLRGYSAVLTDLGMPELGGEALCRRLLEIAPDLPIIVVTGNGSVEGAVAAMRAGAFDFITKPVDKKLLDVAVARAVRHAGLQSEVKRLREQASERANIGSLIGDSVPMRRVQDLISRVGPSEASVLIWGETGTGKELVARAIHSVSNRKDGPFVAINCAAVPATLLESELFGHARGAFTDAKQQRPGLFQKASGGTLFLDEIGEMPLDMQAKLLRALQERTVRPVGADAEVPFDARIITATHRDLEAAVSDGKFRQDLYFRINVVRVDLPPLRERGGDILRLAHHFLAAMAERSGREILTIGPAVAERLLGYDWPGNVRELENCIERATALAQADAIAVEDLPDRVRLHEPDRFIVSANEPEELITLDELEKRYILRVLKLTDGNRSRAAIVLGLDRRTLYRKLSRYESERKSGEPISLEMPS
jgi:two-component system response regulator HydG